MVCWYVFVDVRPHLRPGVEFIDTFFRIVTTLNVELIDMADHGTNNIHTPAGVGVGNEPSVFSAYSQSLE